MDFSGRKSSAPFKRRVRKTSRIKAWRRHSCPHFTFNSPKIKINIHFHLSFNMYEAYSKNYTIQSLIWTSCHYSKCDFINVNQRQSTKKFSLITVIHQILPYTLLYVYCAPKTILSNVNFRFT